MKKPGRIVFLSITRMAAPLAVAAGLLLFAAPVHAGATYWFSTSDQVTGDDGSTHRQETLRGLNIANGHVQDGAKLTETSSAYSSFFGKPQNDSILYRRSSDGVSSIRMMSTSGKNARELLAQTPCLTEACTSASTFFVGTLSAGARYVSFTRNGKSLVLNTASGATTTLPSVGDRGYAVQFSASGTQALFHHAAQVGQKTQQTLYYGAADGTGWKSMPLGKRSVTFRFTPNGTSLLGIGSVYHQKLRRTFTTVEFRSAENGGVLAQTTLKYPVSNWTLLSDTVLLAVEMKKSKMVIHRIERSGTALTDAKFASIAKIANDNIPSIERIDNTTALVVHRSAEGSSSMYKFLSVQSGAKKEIYRTTLASATGIRLLGFED